MEKLLEQLEEYLKNEEWNNVHIYWFGGKIRIELNHNCIDSDGEFVTEGDSLCEVIPIVLEKAATMEPYQHLVKL